ncbi:DUF523 domain-containing protein [Pseudomonas oryzicola]|uniref:DUF523 domain-containing protein n=1 Tax=Pseudomonas oryzicola TaxID=485876 RepID=A0ABS6Q5C4_9PSED|nr:DUF523 domain-containing protein [Pseudomonas oryzicola]MBV4489373.1 DUF523 domain-containing protein [Pseudomonas oryzicola]
MTRSELPKVLVSACLLGQAVRYDGRTSGYPELLQRWQVEGRVVPLCPEVAGGLPTPRAPAEIPGGQGAAVLDGDVQVLTVTAEDVSAQFIAGAQQALELVRRHGIRVAVLKAGSPSCGNRLIYDGTFSGVKVAGEGVTTALLRRAGVQVFSELELEQAEQALAGLSV